MGNNLKVKTAELDAFGTDLVEKADDFRNQLSNLATLMNQIQGSWKDHLGAEFAEKYKSFVDQSKAITDDLSNLGNLAKNRSKDYYDLESICRDQMG